MGIFKTIESAFAGMVYDITNSSDMCKLIRNDNYDPLSLPSPATPTNMIYIGGDVIETIEHRIFLTPKIPTISEEKKTIIIPRIEAIQTPGGDNFYYRDFVTSFNILTHVSLWAIKGNGIRVLQIADLINNLYDRQRKEQGIGWAIPIGVQRIQPNDNWCGYALGYKFTNFSKNTS